MTAGVTRCVSWLPCQPHQSGPFERPPPPLLVRFAIKLLEDVVFFVADVLNSGQPVLDVVMGKVNRERQKLMREQNILKQVRAQRRSPALAGGARRRVDAAVCKCVRRFLAS